MNSKLEGKFFLDESGCLYQINTKGNFVRFKPELFNNVSFIQKYGCTIYIINNNELYLYSWNLDSLRFIHAFSENIKLKRIIYGLSNCYSYIQLFLDCDGNLYYTVSHKNMTKIPHNQPVMDIYCVDVSALCNFYYFIDNKSRLYTLLFETNLTSFKIELVNGINGHYIGMMTKKANKM